MKRGNMAGNAEIDPERQVYVTKRANYLVSYGRASLSAAAGTAAPL